MQLVKVYILSWTNFTCRGEKAAVDVSTTTTRDETREAFGREARDLSKLESRAVPAAQVNSRKSTMTS